MLIAGLFAVLMAGNAHEMIIPEGTVLPVVLNETLNTKKVQDNDPILLSLADDRQFQDIPARNNGSALGSVLFELRRLGSDFNGFSPGAHLHADIQGDSLGYVDRNPRLNVFLEAIALRRHLIRSSRQEQDCIVPTRARYGRGANTGC